MSNRERVLVVDEISDTAEVLQAVLEPRGVTVNRVCHWGQTDLPTVENRPAVVVYDAESPAGETLAAELLANGALPAGGNWHGVPQIIIGTIRLDKSGKGESDRAQPDSKDAVAPHVERRYLQKPFQFAELVQAIEALIAGGTSDTPHGVN